MIFYQLHYCRPVKVNVGIGRAAEYPPERVAHICGIAAETVNSLARAYGTTRPAAIRANYGMQRHAGGGNAMRAVACLPALIGAWRDPAGGALLSSSGTYPVDAAALDDLSPLAVLRRGYSLVRRLPEQEIVRSAQALAPGDEVEIAFSEGAVRARVEGGGRRRPTRGSHPAPVSSRPDRTANTLAAIEKFISFIRKNPVRKTGDIKALIEEGRM
jgi:anaerobic selenocysteine-containing dehydrogenase